MKLVIFYKYSVQSADEASILYMYINDIYIFITATDSYMSRSRLIIDIYI